jgi:hypothetical protein
MILSQMISLVNSYIDDVVINDDAIRWLNMAKDRMATEVKATFPDLPTVAEDNSLTATFVFPSKYHEIPCFYAAAMYKAQESSLNEKMSYLQQFELALRNFTENYNPPAEYRDEPNILQYTAVADQTDFVIASDVFAPYYGNKRFYVNSIPSESFTIENNTKFTYVGTTPLVAGDKVTLIFDENANFLEPPYSWWKGW